MGVLRLVIGRSGELVPLDYVSGRERAAGAVSFAVAARLLPGSGIWDGAGPAEVTRQAGDQGVCGGGGEGI